METIDPTELQRWLEWANAKLIAMPGRRIGPAEPGVAWPDFSQDRWQVLEFRQYAPLRALAPNKDEITVLEDILTLPNVCERLPVRRTLHARAVVHPVNGRHLFPWTRIAKILEVKAHTVKYWHKIGLVEVSRKANPQTVCRISAFMAERF